MSELELLWQAHWPSLENCCEQSDQHRMVRSDGNWQCIGCMAWVSDEEHLKLIRWMERASFVTRGMDGGALRPLVCETW